MSDPGTAPAAVPKRYRKRQQQQTSDREKLTLQTDSLSVRTGGSTGSDSTNVMIKIQLPTQSVIKELPVTTRVDQLIAELQSEHRYELPGESIMLWETVSTMPATSLTDRRIVIRRPLRSSECVGVISSTWDATTNEYGFYLRASDAAKRLDTASLAFLHPRRDVIKTPPAVSEVPCRWSRGMRTRPSAALLTLTTTGMMTLKSTRDSQRLTVNDLDVYEVLPPPGPRCIVLRSQQSPGAFTDLENSINMLAFESDEVYDLMRNAVFTARSHVLDQITRSFVDVFADTPVPGHGRHQGRSQASSPLTTSIPPKNQPALHENGLTMKKHQPPQGPGRYSRGSSLKNSPISPHSPDPFMPHSLLASSAIPAHDKFRPTNASDASLNWTIQTPHIRK